MLGKIMTLTKYLLFGFVIQASGLVLTAAAADIYVPLDFGTIQAAIGASADGDTIWVADGSYTGPGNYNINTLGKEITVRSENGLVNCIIDCQNNGRAFIFQNGETTTTVIRGFTIINGYAEGTSWPQSSADDPSGYGGAIYCRNSGPLIRDCNITDNIADSGGGAIFCDDNGDAYIAYCDINYNYAGYGFYRYGFDVNAVDINDLELFGGAIYCKNADPTILWSTIDRNRVAGSGGGIACDEGNADISLCDILENEAWVSHDSIMQHGGGVYCQGGTPIIYSCDIRWNQAKWSGGGIAAFDSNLEVFGNPIFDDPTCLIIDNDCWASGGGIYSDGNPGAPNTPNCHIERCLVADNFGYWSGGISSNNGSVADITNCTIANNIVSWQHLVGGLECYGGTATVTNSIIWGNVGVQISGANDVTYSDVQILDSNGLIDTGSVWPGAGNINEDPLFVNPIRRDYHVQAPGVPPASSGIVESGSSGAGEVIVSFFETDDANTSPCINAGDPFSDYSLELQPNGGRINMGAYGGTEQASRSDILRPVPSDANADLAVDLVDFALLVNNWFLEGTAIKDRKADADNNGIVDERDLLILCKYWLWLQ